MGLGDFTIETGETDMVQREKKHVIILDFPVFIYMVYLSFLVLCDVANFGVYILSGGRIPVYVLLLFGAVFVFCVYRFREYICIEKLRMDLMAYIFLGLIFVLAFIRGILPDTSYDVMNARVFWQFPGFQDNIDYNTFPAAFTFFFPLPDRIFYYPRVLLGYRLGTITNAFVLALVYIEIRELVETLLGGKLSVLWKDMEKYSSETQVVVKAVFNKSFLAAVSCLLYYIIAELGTYMVDITALPLLLVLLKKLFAKECDTSIIQFALTAYMAGICIALKVSNVIFLVPLILIYVIKNRKNMRIRDFLVCIIVGIFPSATYLIYAYISTGNPVYWMYNAIFKSPYYIDSNFKDRRWGPDNTKDYLLWPWKLVVGYDSRVSELSKLPQIYILLGWISSVYLIVRGCIKRIWDRGMTIFILLFGVFYVQWLYSTGYPRYAIICEIMAAIICMSAVCDLLMAHKKILRVIAATVMLALVLQMQLNYMEGINNRYDWSWRGTTAENIANGKLFANLKWLLRDRGTIGTDEQHSKVDIFLESYTNSQYMKMFDEDIPIINGDYIETYLTQVRDVKGIDYPAYYKEKIMNALEEGKGVYDLLAPKNIYHAIDLANAWGLRITECEYVESFYTKDEYPVLIRYELANEDNEFLPVDFVDIDTSILGGSHNAQLGGIVYLDSTTAPYCTLALMVEWADGGTIEQKINLDAGNLYDLSQYFSIPGVDAEDRVYLEVLEEGITVNIANLVTSAH